jgi:diguanylate cyclase (GGDEF)-like protein/PAS domain S-box-containing protein
MWVRRKLSGLVLVVLTVGAAAPAALWALWDVQDTRLRLYQAFDQDIRQFQGKLASGLQAPLWDLNPELATPLLDAQFQDTRLVSLSVLTDTRQLFYHRDELRRRDGHCATRYFPVLRQGRELGRTLAEFCDGVVQAQIARERDERLWLIGTQFGLTLLLIVAMLHWRLVLPVRQLVAQARALAERQLLRPFLWRRQDELGQLGNALETTRQALAQLFSRLEQQNQALLAELGQREAISQALAHSQRRYQALVDEAPEGIALLNPDSGQFIEGNPQAARLLGCRPDALARHTPFDAELVALPDAPALWQQRWRQALRAADDGALSQFRWRFQPLDGQPQRHIDVHLGRLDTGGDRAIRATLLDVTAQVTAERQLHLLQRAVEQSHDGIAILDSELRLRSCNPGFYRLFSDEQTGQLLPGLSTDNPALYQALLTRLDSEGSWQDAMWLNTRAGSRYCQVRISRIVSEEDPDNHICVVTDTTESHQQEDRIRYLAHHDPVTGLTNRHFLYGRMAEAIHQLPPRPFALGFLDLDRFKTINDTLGHAAGDCLLQAVARRLQTLVRADDLVSRIGGDEFVILASEMCCADEAAMLFSRVLAAFHDPFELEGKLFHISPSIGVCFFPADGDTPDILMRNADTAMYAAKAAGRNTYQLFAQAMHAQNAERLDLEREMRNGVQAQQFVAYYQPKVNADGELLCCEALVRWQHPALGVLSPARFLPLAEETGLIVAIGRQVLLAACHDCLRWRQSGYPDMRVAVNVSSRQFSHDDLAATVQSCLDDSGLPPDALELEITESLLLDNLDAAIRLLQALRALGVKISLDDFGTGYSSLSYLQKLPIDTLKIDRSFIQHIDSRSSDAAITRAIITLAHGLGVRVVAEGVETASQCAVLVEMQCDLMQGFWFSRPVPAQTLAAMLGQRLGGQCLLPEESAAEDS